jgi:hypothetical protein
MKKPVLSIDEPRPPRNDLVLEGYSSKNKRVERNVGIVPCRYFPGPVGSLHFWSQPHFEAFAILCSKWPVS